MLGLLLRDPSYSKLALISSYFAFPCFFLSFQYWIHSTAAQRLVANANKAAKISTMSTPVIANSFPFLAFESEKASHISDNT